MNAKERMSCSIDISSQVPPHAGFGGGTATALALTEALHLWFGRSTSPQTLISESGRGGASGVGIQAYFSGGVVWDFGHRKDDGVLMPSEGQRPTSIPVFGPMINFPSSWLIHVALPKGKSVWGESEKDFFSDNTPLSRADGLETISLVHHGVIPAIISEDLTTLRQSLYNLHSVGFKARELRFQESGVRKLYSLLVQNGYCCGMSSFGPAIYIITDRVSDGANAQLGELCKAVSAELTGPVPISNGRKVEIVK